MRIPRKVLVPIVLASTIGLGGVAHACPNCKEALASQTGEGAKLKDGYYYSILLMMAMPFTLLGTGAFLVVRAVRNGSLPEM
jgi:hypothetical protein